MTNDYAGAVQWAEANPTHLNLATGKHEDWDGWCDAFVDDAGAFTRSFLTAHAAYRASAVRTPAQLPIEQVPTGWILWWDYIGADGTNYGHVAIAAPGSTALMASGYVTDPIHPHLGYVDRAGYGRASGHPYLGASPDHGGEYLKGITRTIPAAPAPAPANVKVPKTMTVLTGGTGGAGSAFWKRMQLLARLGGYTGPIDGVLAIQSWKGIQTVLHARWGYEGLIDGKPGPLTYAALQRLAAARGGYRGPIDGKPARATWRGVAQYLNRL